MWLKPHLCDYRRSLRRATDAERHHFRETYLVEAYCLDFDFVLSSQSFGRIVVAGSRQRNHPDFPLRGFERCETCGRPLTGSWSKGRNGHYAYYHCQRQCRAVNISKTTLEGAFVDELALLQPTPGYMRLVKDRILCVWEQRRAEAKDRTTEQQWRVGAIRQKLDKLGEAFLYSEAIDVTTYGRQRDKLREELTLAKIDHHAEAVDELDVEGILAFAKRILPRASDLWVQASLDYQQRLQQLFFPEGIAFDGNRFNRTALTAPLFNYLAPSESADERVASRIFVSWNQLEGCCGRLRYCGRQHDAVHLTGAPDLLTLRLSETLHAVVRKRLARGRAPSRPLATAASRRLRRRAEPATSASTGARQDCEMRDGHAASRR